MAEKSVIYNIYNPKVKVTGWNVDDSYPRDNDAYDPCHRNFFLSTHNRLGSDDSGFPVSTTREMQDQILTKKTIVKKCGALRSIQRQGSYKDSCKYIMREGKGVFPMDHFITDYITTNKYEYRHPNPHLDKPFTKDLSPPPPIYRKVSICGNRPQSKFLDEATCQNIKCYPDHKRIPPHVYLDEYYRINLQTKNPVIKSADIQTCNEDSSSNNKLENK